MIVVARAPAYATIQDAGRTGFRAAGVPRAGAMDELSLLTLNAMLGNSPGAATLEWALTGGVVEMRNAVTFAVGGSPTSITLSGQPMEMWRPHRASRGAVLELSAPGDGRFCYLGVRGGFQNPVVMGSRSTYVAGAFGGHAGRRLRNGDSLPVGAASRRRRHHVNDALPERLRPPLALDFIRYIARTDIELAPEWKISATSDRTGYRLESDVRHEGASITSECVGPGVIQLPPGGSPIVLMADAPTIGGYRIAGCVITSDLGALAQRAPGNSIVLEPISVEQAQRELSHAAERLDAVREWSLG